jgi:hypothetical protein
MDHGSQKHGVAWRFTKAKALDRRFNVMGFHDLCYLFLFPLAFLVFSLQLQRLPGFFCISFELRHKDWRWMDCGRTGLAKHHLPREGP